MDDRHFDSLTRAIASAPSRRSLIKGLLGLAGLAVVGTVARDDEPAEAAVRPTPSPTPVKCPGQQTWNGTACICLTGQSKCGPACCNTTNIPAPNPNHSECCDNACCAGTCYGEELCCPTNNRPGGQGPIAAVCPDGSCCVLPNKCFQGTCQPPTPTPTNTPTKTPTNTPTNTPTKTPTNTPTSTPTKTPTNTPRPPTQTPTPTNTPAPTTTTPTNTPTTPACACGSGETCCPTAAGGFVCCPPSGTCEDNAYIEYTCTAGECVRSVTSCTLDVVCKTGVCLQNQGCFEANDQNGSACGDKGICCNGTCAQCCGTDTSNCEAFGFDAACVVCFQGTACSDGGTEFLACPIGDDDQGWCNNGHCIPCSGIGDECIESTQCCSINCDGETCLPPDND